jgi:acyl-coenzyme A synthetase/AMP-(fatty) acid ligase
VIADEVTVLNGKKMVDLINDRKINVWYSVPSSWTLMLEQGNLLERGVDSLDVVFFAGEVFPMKHLRAAMKAVRNAEWHNLFGPTETNVCTAYQVGHVPDEDETSIPIGAAVCGNETAVVDCGVGGDVGELIIKGPTVALGYWNGGNPKYFNGEYSTGDLVSIREDGNLMYHGRSDHMVKVNGFRIEIGEVEAALCKHDNVKEAIVFADNQKLFAVVVPNDVTLSVMGLKQHSGAHLPKYMIPSDIRIVESLPRTSSGKTDRVKTKQAAIVKDETILTSIKRG